jgi:hypothetical protein
LLFNLGLQGISEGEHSHADANPAQAQLVAAT